MCGAWSRPQGFECTSKVLPFPVRRVGSDLHVKSTVLQSDNQGQPGAGGSRGSSDRSTRCYREIEGPPRPRVSRDLPIAARLTVACFLTNHCAPKVIFALGARGFGGKRMVMLGSSCHRRVRPRALALWAVAADSHSHPGLVELPNIPNATPRRSGLPCGRRAAVEILCCANDADVGSWKHATTAAASFGSSVRAPAAGPASAAVVRADVPAA